MLTEGASFAAKLCEEFRDPFGITPQIQTFVAHILQTPVMVQIKLYNFFISNFKYSDYATP